MADAPSFRTAIPKRRYRIGEFQCVVLGDVESTDEHDYVYVFAMVRDGGAEPSLYVALEDVRASLGGYRLRVVAADQSKSFDAGPAVTDLDGFTEAALDAAVRLFRLEDEQPYRLM